MNNDFTIQVEYLNRDMQKVGEGNFTLSEYTDLIDLELKRVIMDIEDIFYEIEEGKPQKEWSKASSRKFQKLRHKLLDQANAVKRLPSELRYKGVRCDSEDLKTFLVNFFKESE